MESIEETESNNDSSGDESDIDCETYIDSDDGGEYSIDVNRVDDHGSLQKRENGQECSGTRCKLPTTAIATATLPSNTITIQHRRRSVGKERRRSISPIAANTGSNQPHRTIKNASS